MKNITESFFLGIIAALGALIVELIIFILFSFFSGAEDSLSFFQMFTLSRFIILGALIEETLKYIVVSQRLENFSLGRKLMINSFFVGFGFFATEICLSYLSGAIPPSNLLVELAIIHVGTAGLMGYVVATRNPKKIGTIILALFLATFFHATYNLLIIDRNFAFNYGIFTLLGFILFFNLINILRINKE